MTTTPAIRGEWGVAVPITKNLTRIRLKNTAGSLMVNTYLFQDNDTVAVVDPGWPWTLDSLKIAFEYLGLTFNDVSHWLYTHTHIDHMGCAAILTTETSAPHIATESVEPYLERWHAFQDESNDWTSWANEALEDPRTIQLFENHRSRTVKNGHTMVARHGERSVDATLHAIGDVIEVGSLRLKMIDAKGHDPHHIAFYEPDRKWLFSGDVLLTTPTPLSRAMNDSLSDYAETLERLTRLDVDLLLPGHGVHREGKYDRGVENSKSHLETLRSKTLEALRSQDDPIGIVALSKIAYPGLFEMSQAQLVVNLGLVDSQIQKLTEQGECKRIDSKYFQAL